MSSPSASGEPNRYPTLDRTDVLRVLVPAERRRLLSIVTDRPIPVSERTLAAHVVADERASTLSDVPAEAVETARVRLKQVHLPALGDAGLVAWYEADAFVASSDHPGLRDPLVQRFLRERSGDTDDVIEALADRRRRTAAAVLQAFPDAMSESSLAREIAARAPDRSTTLEDVLVSLRHAHLPKLDAAGLVEYDRVDGTVTYRGHPALAGPWFGWSVRERPGPRSPAGPPEDHTNHEND